jgi:hypothetical protein
MQIVSADRRRSLRMTEDAGCDMPTERSKPKTARNSDISKSPSLLTKRLEFGEALDSSEAQEPLAQCTFSKVSADSRLLTHEDVYELGIEEKLIGAVAEIETSIHGVAWVRE